MTATQAGGSTRLHLRQLSSAAELTAAAALIDQVFGSEEPMPVDVLVAVACAGGFVGAAELDGELVGVAMAFGEAPRPGSVDAPGLHSHVAAVRSTARGLHIGRQLKWYQRQWALERGIALIHWTFDPLVRRNAVLNLNRLGAVATAYHEDLYGSIPDALNAGLASDRLLVRWELTSPRVEAAAAGTPLTTSASERSTVGTIETPPDIERLVAADPVLAQQWRHRQRAAFAALPDGWLVTGIDPAGRYEWEQR